MSNFKAGDLIASRYAFERDIGSPGALGYAVLARDTLTQETVVCKLPIAECGHEEFLAQYKRLRSIMRGEVAQAIAYDQHHFRNSVHPVLVLEFVVGATVDEWRPGKSHRERMSLLNRVATATP